jgi:hypothetical protein
MLTEEQIKKWYDVLVKADECGIDCKFLISVLLKQTENENIMETAGELLLGIRKVREEDIDEPGEDLEV